MDNIHKLFLKAIVILLTLAFVYSLYMPLSHADDNCCILRWNQQTASGSVDFIVYTCCQPPLSPYCTVTVTSEWIKYVPVWSDPVYDCSLPNTAQIGARAYTTYISTSSYTIDTHNCPFCPCLIVPPDVMTLGDLIHRLDNGETIPSTQVYTCGI